MTVTSVAARPRRTDRCSRRDALRLRYEAGGMSLAETTIALSSKRLFVTPWIIANSCSLSRGHIIEFVSIRIRVAACLVDGDRIVLVTHQKGDSRYQLLPGGGVDEGETLSQALAREVTEETGLIVSIGRLLIVCESIDPDGNRHILNLVYAGEITGGALKPGQDGTLVDAGWFTKDQLAQLKMFPAINTELRQCWEEGFKGPVVSLGNIWKS